MSWAKEAGFLLSLVPGNPMIRAGQLNSMLISNALHGHLPLAQLRKSRSMTSILSLLKQAPVVASPRLARSGGQSSLSFVQVCFRCYCTQDFETRHVGDMIPLMKLMLFQPSPYQLPLKQHSLGAFGLS